MSDETDPGVVTPWMLAIQKLDAIHADVGVLKVQTATLVQAEKDHKEQLEDHEKRLRSLEEYITKARGALALAGVLAGTVGGIVVWALSKAFG